VKLAASNIGWDGGRDTAAYELLRRHGVTGVEVAPSRLWQQPASTTAGDIAAARRQFQQEGLTVVALQALLFGRPDLQLFGEKAGRDRMANYLEHMVNIAAGLGARALVFGSPKNRLLCGRSKAEADRIACEFFRRVGDSAASRGAALCLEPNPTEYGCDYLNRLSETVELVQRIDTPGVRVQLDVSSLILNKEDPAEVIPPALPWIGHIHCSEPFLEGVGKHLPVHARVAEVLKDLAWPDWVSLEMRASGSLDTLEEALTRLREIYGEDAGADRTAA
jgi:sugar phosphate isomerase/epimerase